MLSLAIVAEKEQERFVLFERGTKKTSQNAIGHSPSFLRHDDDPLLPNFTPGHAARFAVALHRANDCAPRSLNRSCVVPSGWQRAGAVARDVRERLWQMSRRQHRAHTFTPCGCQRRQDRLALLLAFGLLFLPADWVQPLSLGARTGVPRTSTVNQSDHAFLIDYRIHFFM